MPRELHPGRRVAVIGTGVSGLVAARELHRAGHRITVFESEDRVGGHSNTVTVETAGGSWAVDTGFIVLNDRNYPEFERILHEIGVPTQPAPMSMGVSDGQGDFEWAATPLGVFAKGAHLFDRRFHRMLADQVRFFREARELVGTGDMTSLRMFCKERGYSEYFVERLIIPQASAVWSADPEQLWSFPVSFLAEFFENHGALQLRGRPRWRTVVGGSRTYVDAISEPFRNRIRLAAPVRELRRDAQGVEVTWDDGVERFDEVVLATHSDTALAMLADPTPAEREVLGAIGYQPNDVVLHTDASLMPRRRRAWACWNYHLADTGSDAAERSTVTYWMNRLQQIPADEEFFVTLNRSEAIDPGKVLRRFSYDHPVFDDAAVRAQGRWDEVSGHNRTHFCGAYWGWGFHEDGVRSGLRAAESLRAGPPAGEDGAELALAA
jgi:predicted NAD/FAD-binding protein